MKNIGISIEEATDYLACGIPSTSQSATVDNHRHGGKEWVGFAGLGWHDNRARWHDALLMRFTTPDPLAEKYPDLSPYAFCANNPMKITDVYGDSLSLFGDISDVNTTISIMNRPLQNLVDISIQNNGLVRMPDLSQSTINKMTTNQIQYYNYLNRIINGNDGHTMVFVENGTSVKIGNAETATIDVADMIALGNDADVNATSALFHELAEQYLIQVRGKSLEKAHNAASALESLVNFSGNAIDSNRRNDLFMNLWIPIKDSRTLDNKGFIIVEFNNEGNVIRIRH